VLELNASRSVEVLGVFWGELKEYYSELGRHKSEKIALFASDFLKQLVTKFLKRKDLLALQREYLRPFEEIFQESKIFAVKELMIGSLSYFVVNHSLSLKSGWKLILSVICSCFEDEEHQIIKEKAYGILRKIAESNFTIFTLEDNYNDFVQILGRLAREKEENYALGCLQIIQQIIEYYHMRLGISLEHGPDAVENEKVDINFWQTVFLPLLSIIFPVCGDWRAAVQKPAIECLFSLLFRYGKLFRY
jgi:brefeldin A-inhibited guanine nucleotide-exchange protein